ncbi:MAG: DUF433 domain-containing protein [Chloroflexota bacterium]
MQTAIGAGARWLLDVKRYGRMSYARITSDSGIMGGVPCIRGLRIPVATVVSMIADGMRPGEILADYPDLDEDDIAEALRFAADAVRERTLPLMSQSA